jgi:hypothetical protein
MSRRAALAALAGLSLSAAAPIETVGPDYKPVDRDERGLWMQVEESERNLQGSNFVIRDEKLNAYVHGVLCRTVGQAECGGVRLYLMRTPYFNASMAPNGMMQVWSGLLLRVRNEAQLSAILGHEYTHYAHRHTLQTFRDLKNKTAAMTWFAFVPFGFVVQLGLAGSVFSFSRDMEREADTGSIGLMVKAGYDPDQASKIWEQLRTEMDATALVRKQKSHSNDNGIFATHPATAERMATLAALARQAHNAQSIATNEDAYRTAMRPFWPSFIDDQIKLNDFGATELLLGQLASDGWTPELLYARAELYRARGLPADLGQATGFYRQAASAAGAPAEVWRGLGLVLVRNGSQSEGQAALREYLTRKPNAKDRAMIAMMAGDKI